MTSDRLFALDPATGSMRAGERTALALILSLLLAAAMAIPFVGHAREGDVMAPGVAQVTTLTPAGDMSVRILDQVFTGTWRIVAAIDQLPLLSAHWKGTRRALSDHTLARAQLRDASEQTLICEFVLVRDAPAGVCEEPLRRLHYLRPGP